MLNLSQFVHNITTIPYFVSILMLPILIFPFLPSIIAYIFPPIIEFFNKLHKQNAYFFVYDYYTQQPICCAPINIKCLNNTKYITLSNKIGLANLLPKHQPTQKCFVSIRHPLYKPMNFEVQLLKDNIQNKKMPNTYMYLNPKQGISFPLTKKRFYLARKIVLVLLRTIYLALLLLMFIILLYQISLHITLLNLLLVLVLNYVLFLYIKYFLTSYKKLLPQLKYKTPCIIVNAKTHQEVAIIEKKNIPIILENGNYYMSTKTVDTIHLNIPLKLQKIGSLYFVKQKAN